MQDHTWSRASVGRIATVPLLLRPQTESPLPTMDDTATLIRRVTRIPLEQQLIAMNSALTREVSAIIAVVSSKEVPTQHARTPLPPRKFNSWAGNSETLGHFEGNLFTPVFTCVGACQLQQDPAPCHAINQPPLLLGPHGLSWSLLPQSGRVQLHGIDRVSANHFFRQDCTPRRQVDAPGMRSVIVLDALSAIAGVTLCAIECKISGSAGARQKSKHNR